MVAVSAYHRLDADTVRLDTRHGGPQRDPVVIAGDRQRLIRDASGSSPRRQPGTGRVRCIGTGVKPAHRIRLAAERQSADNRNVIDYRCPGCGVPCATDLPERVDQPCGLCAAKATWESLPADTQRAIDTAIIRGAIPGLIAMQDADPPIHLPHAMDLLAFRSNAALDDAPAAE